MVNIKLFQLDSFTDKVFSGNPAAVCPLDSWLDDAMMQSIAAENNLSETAFFVGANGKYELRWFTPVDEVDLCGHATLASAQVIMTELEPDCSQITFSTRSGDLYVGRDGDTYIMDFPARVPRTVDVPAALLAAVSIAPQAVLADEDYLLIYNSQSDIEQLKVDLEKLKRIPLRGVIVTSPGDDVDFVSRFFAPKLAIDEDPVTGSAHCALTPYWAEKMAKTKFVAKQLSQRGGTINCELDGSRVKLSGQCVKYLEGNVWLP
ncbi:MAG: PhzF family phenazine biosynthesis protein [Spongiibacteraceae bacterium]